jgi:hypothetical protein
VHNTKEESRQHRGNHAKKKDAEKEKEEVVFTKSTTPKPRTTRNSNKSDYGSTYNTPKYNISCDSHNQRLSCKDSKHLYATKKCRMYAPDRRNYQ